MVDSFSIAQVEQATGIPKDLLRQWERRYGYPSPQRNAQGDRVYSQEDIAKLDMIHRLMELGLRPGKLVLHPLQALSQMHAQGMQVETERLQELLPLLKATDLAALREWLDERLQTQGLRRFVCDTLPQLNDTVGNAWQIGEVSVHEEHLYSEQINNLLRGAISTLSAPAQGCPRVLLTTPEGEQHGLGLLMAETMLRHSGCITISLGTGTPAAEIVQAANQFKVRAVALSISESYSSAEAKACLEHLRQALPAPIALWAGGRGIATLAPVSGVRFMHSMQDVLDGAEFLQITSPPQETARKTDSAVAGT